MPLNLPDKLPAIELLKEENIFVIDNSRATQQDIRPLRIVILNLMPLKITTETDLVRLLSNTPLQVEISFMKIKSHTSKNTPIEHMKTFYTDFDKMRGEKYGRPIFYGAMVTEGIVALIWAAAATYFFHQNGMEESNASIIVDRITKEWLGTIGGLLAVLGVIAAPITSGDTALRSARLIVADFMHLEQKSITRRLLICIPIFAVTIGILLYSQRDAAGFDMIWRYFAWCNQTLSVFTLWAITVYLVRMKKNYYVTLLPALFMTAVCSTYICIAPEGLALSGYISYVLGGICTLVAVIGFITWYKKQNSIVYEEI